MPLGLGDRPAGFWGIAAVMLAVSGVMLWVFRKQDWL
jgi:Mg2+ and Co2+ transporter CorA